MTILIPSLDIYENNIGNYKPVPSAGFSVYVELSLPVISKKQPEIPCSQSFLTWSFMMAFRGDITRTHAMGSSERKGISWNMILFPNPVGRRHTMSFDSLKARSAVICSGFNSYVIPIFCLAFVIRLKSMVFVEVKVEKTHVFCIILMKWK